MHYDFSYDAFCVEFDDGTVFAGRRDKYGSAMSLIVDSGYPIGIDPNDSRLSYGGQANLVDELHVLSDRLCEFDPECDDAEEYEANKARFSELVTVELEHGYTAIVDTADGYWAWLDGDVKAIKDIAQFEGNLYVAASVGELWDVYDVHEPGCVAGHVHADQVPYYSPDNSDVRKFVAFLCECFGWDMPVDVPAARCAVSIGYAVCVANEWVPFGSIVSAAEVSRAVGSPVCKAWLSDNTGVPLTFYTPVSGDDLPIPFSVV